MHLLQGLTLVAGGASVVVAFTAFRLPQESGVGMSPYAFRPVVAGAGIGLCALAIVPAGPYWICGAAILVFLAGWAGVRTPLVSLVPENDRGFFRYPWTALFVGAPVGAAVCALVEASGIRGRRGGLPPATEDAAVFGVVLGCAVALAYWEMAYAVPVLVEQREQAAGVKSRARDERSE